jgi:hypothetical protein
MRPPTVPGCQEGVVPSALPLGPLGLPGHAGVREQQRADRATHCAKKLSRAEERGDRAEARRPWRMVSDACPGDAEAMSRGEASQ